MNLSSPSPSAVPPIHRPSRPVHLQGFFEGRQSTLLRKLRDRLPGCGAWILGWKPCAGSSGAREAIELRFEVLVGSAWELYTLLLSLGLDMTPASHRELCTFCVICQNREVLAMGATVDMRLKVSCGPRTSLPRADTDRSRA